MRLVLHTQINKKRMTLMQEKESPKTEIYWHISIRLRLKHTSLNLSLPPLDGHYYWLLFFCHLILQPLD